MNEKINGIRAKRKEECIITCCWTDTQYLYRTCGVVLHTGSAVQLCYAGGTL